MSQDVHDQRAVLSHFPTGVAILTGHGPDGPVGLTVQSFMSLSLDPPLVLVAVDRRSTSWPEVAKAEGFAVNVLSSEQQEVALRFARSGGPKYEEVEWTPGDHSGAPLLLGAQAWIECKIWNTYDGGDHEIIIGFIQALRAADDPTLHPLLFLRSNFPRLDGRSLRSAGSDLELEFGFI